jgi:PDZ domain-containing protein
VPYVTLSPGPVFDTLGQYDGTDVVKVSGRPTYETDGALDATTVSVTDHVSLVEALAGWFSRDDAVVPRELVYPPEQSEDETETRNAQDMVQSQDDALVAAMGVLGIKGTTEVLVGRVEPQGPSDGTLRAGDVLVSVDGKPVPDVPSLRALIGTRRPGEPVVVGYRREGKAASARLVTKAADDDPKRPVIGVNISTRSDFPVDVEIELQDVGGPSAGLMFALSIVDKLQPGSLTGGKHIAGTGEMAPDGKVGAIGGIAQKMRGARKVGATVFLVPAANCAEARRSVPDGLQLVRVETLRGALAALGALGEGGSVPSC